MASTVTTGFRSRLIIAGVGLLTLAMVAFSTFASLIFDRYLQEQLEEAAMQQRVLLGAALLAPMLQRDYATVEAVIRESRAVRGVDYIAVFDRQRQLVATDGPVPPAVAVGGEAGDAAADRTFHFSGAIAAGGDAVGHIAFGLSKTLIADARRSLLLGALGVGLIIVLVFSVLFAWISYRLTRPLIALSQATRKMQGGDYSIELTYRGSDEIGALTDDFRQLAARIREQIAKVTASENLQRHYRQSAEQASQAKSEFLAKMSHEIRTPLHGVLGMLELLQGNHSPLEQREHLQLAERSARHLLQVVDEILDFSKIEAGKMQLEATPFDFGELAGDVVALFSPAAAAKDVTMTLTRENIPAALVGDPTRLRQVLSNLLSNAVKFTEAGHIRLHCAWQHDPQVLHVVLEDSGIGIPADKREAIFQPFSQADSSTTRRYGGTGLGLTICRRLVQMMGGEIGVDSTVGVGSTFHFTARLELASQAQLEKRAEVLAPQRKLNVLLVEDHPINQMLAVMLLERAGHRVSVAATGLDGIAQWRSISPDLILMDVQMPVMDGLEATRRIREAEAAEKLPRTPIIAMTANAFAEDREACLAAGMDAYLSKPVKPETMHEAIAKQLQPRR